MKKTTVRSIMIGSITLTAVTAGAWFILTSEPPQKKVGSLVPPSSSGAMQQQASTKSDFDGSLAAQPTNPADETQKVAPDLYPIDPLPGNTQKNTTEEKKEQNSAAENTEDSATTAGEPIAPSALSSLQAFEDIDEGEMPNNAETECSFLPGEEEQQQKEGNISGPSCKEVSPVLTNFVNSLEKKDYSKEESSDQPLQEHFNALATQLVNNPPVVIHETDDLYTVLTNTAHFFRILGKDNMRLLRKVLKQETADFENIAAEIYRFSTGKEQCVSGNKRLEIPFTAAYEYAGFFLNTLGGRSYLFRRESGTRLLINYYAVLILDQANKKHLNSYGLDIREQLPWLIQEMEANNQLTHKERYIDKLYELAENYQALP
ncbi:hypothetical protein GMJAKD_11165 [Candidatus Electrothrix aarhusensis]|jgi:hypothetical protein